MGKMKGINSNPSTVGPIDKVQIGKWERKINLMFVPTDENRDFLCLWLF